MCSAIPPIPTGYISQAANIESDHNEGNSPSSCPQVLIVFGLFFTPWPKGLKQLLSGLHDQFRRDQIVSETSQKNKKEEEEEM